jgi:Uma2 family endonuclease
MPIVTIEVPVEVPEFPQIELLETDGEPLESDWHRIAMNVLIDSVKYHLRHRHDFYVGGNMFVYFSLEEARNRDFRGPDFFFVDGVPSEPLRPYWAVWMEGGRYPDMIIELLSPKTATEDRTTKKAVYERVFHTTEYYCYDPATQQLEGWRLVGGRYQPLEPNAQGWLWCEQLQLWLGTWVGAYLTNQATWLRFYDSEGRLVPVPAEVAEAEHQQAEAERQRAEAERQRAEAERQRAEAAEAELAQLRARLAQLEER